MAASQPKGASPRFSFLPPSGRLRSALSSAALVVSALFLSYTLLPDSAVGFAAAGAACYFATKIKSARHLYFIGATFLSLSLFSWGVLFATVLLFAVLVAELWAENNRLKQSANLAAAGLCITALLFNVLPAIAVHIVPPTINPVLPLLITALIAALEAASVKIPSRARLADPLLIILLTTLTMCYLLVVALLAVSIGYPQAILFAAAGGVTMLAAGIILTSPFFQGNILSTLQHLFALHVPIETWVANISASTAEENSAAGFAARIGEQFLSLPGICGVEWRMNEHKQTLGQQSKHTVDVHCPPLFIRLYRHRRALPWDWFNYYLLARISSEYCRAKQREEEQRVDNLSRAVHQTGARLTHDIKNILHALTALTQSADTPLIKRQLPILKERLETTLAKLQKPAAAAADARLINIQQWQTRAQARHQHQAIRFAFSAAPAGEIPADLFDMALDNFIANAVFKKQSENCTDICARLTNAGGVLRLEVEDNGAPIPAAVAATLFHQPIESAFGFGVGLYQVQLEAQKYGGQAALAHNEDGKVIFCLSVARPGGGTAV